jgi:hypothetical protein
LPIGPDPLSINKPRPRLRRIGILWAALIVIAIGGAMWLARAPLLQGAASLWIVSDPLEPADVVAIFGGGLDVRPFAAAKYFHEGLVKKILISNVRPGPAERIGAVMSHVEVTRHVLLKLNVPEAAIDVFGVGNTNTRDEATSLAVRWIVRHAFAGTDTNVQIQALDSTDFNRRDWWGFEAGVVAFQNEVIKYIYYRIKY